MNIQSIHSSSFNHIPVFNLGRFDRITDVATGQNYCWLDTGRFDYRFKQLDGNIPVVISHEEFHLQLNEGVVEVHKDALLESAPEVRHLFQNQCLSDIPEVKMERAHYYADLFNAYLRRKEQKPRSVSLSSGTLKKIMPELAEEIAPIWKKKSRPGPNAKTFHLPSPRHFARLFRLYVNSGYQVAALVDRYSEKRVRQTAATPEELQLRLEFALKYATPTKPSMATVYKALVAKTALLNAERADKGQARLRVPSRKTFEKLIRSLDKFAVTKAREGLAAAVEKAKITGTGVDVTRPGERIEMDEWKVDLMTLLTWLGIAETLSPSELAAVARSRLWLTVAIDCATRCILAMRFTAKEPSAESSMGALEMILMDKTHLSDAAGTVHPWIQSCRPECVVTDNGAAFIAIQFRTALADLRVKHMLPPAGVSSLRPFVEAFFKTTSTFVEWYSGRTFSDYIEKGDYDSEANARVSVDELNRDFVRILVDGYHNTPHSGLAGETPRNAWLRLSREYGIQPVPSNKQRRRIFGIKCKRSIGDEGVRILGLHYQSPELQRIRVYSSQSEVEVRFDRFDLSHASVNGPDGWFDLPNRFGLPRGVSIWEWVAACKHLTEIHADNAKITNLAAMAVIDGLRVSGEASVARAEFGKPVMTDKHVKAIEDKLFHSLRLIETDKVLPPPANIGVAFNPLALDIDPLVEIELDEPAKPDQKAPAQAATTSQFGNANQVVFNRKEQK